MGAENAEARFAINLDGNAGEASAAMGSEVEQLRQSISGSTDAVKQMQAALRSLRGSTDEVKAAKDDLKAKLDAARASISANNLALLKQGTTYEKVASEAKEAEKEIARLNDEMKSKAIADAKAQTDAMGNAIHVAGGPVETLKAKFDSLDKVLGGAGGAMGAFALVAAGTVAAIAALAGVMVGLTAAFVKFVVGGADAARSLNLVREAATGSADNARNLGTQVDALAAKVPTAKNELNDLAVRLDRTRLSGQAIVDTFNAVGQASAAMGDQVGKQLEDIITRGQITQRIQINPLELQGTGLQFKDIAAQLAKQMGIGVKDAQAALFEGRVKLDDGAKALRAAVEARFGEINARKLLSLDVQVTKFKEKLGALTADVKIEPLLKSIDTLSHLFDNTTVSGAALKQLITLIGDQIGPAFQAGTPIAAQFFKGLVIGALLVTISFLKLKKQFKETFGDSAKDVDVMGIALRAAVAPLKAISLALDRITAAMRLFQQVKGAVDAKGIGGAISDGVASGVQSGGGAITGAVSAIADKVKDAFSSALGIHSPSKVFAGFGANTVEGFAGGVQASTHDASAAVGTMATEVATAGVSARAGATAGASSLATMAATAPTVAPPMVGGGAGGSSGPIDVTVNINVEGGAGGDTAKQLSEPSFIAQLKAAIRDALIGAGVPTQGAT